MTAVLSANGTDYPLVDLATHVTSMCLERVGFSHEDCAEPWCHCGCHLSAGEAQALFRLGSDLEMAHQQNSDWTVRAALVQGTALVLTALQGQPSERALGTGSAS